MYRTFSGGVKYDPIHRRRFDLIRGPRCTGSECVIEMMTSLHGLLAPKCIRWACHERASYSADRTCQQRRGPTFPRVAGISPVVLLFAFQHRP